MREISFFLFIFTFLIVIRVLLNFFRSLLSNPPKPLVLGSRELIITGLSLSYIITYIIKL